MLNEKKKWTKSHISYNIANTKCMAYHFVLICEQLECYGVILALGKLKVLKYENCTTCAGYGKKRVTAYNFRFHA